jgi:hypothetical protein
VKPSKKAESVGSGLHRIGLEGQSDAKSVLGRDEQPMAKYLMRNAIILKNLGTAAKIADRNADGSDMGGTHGTV